MEEMKVLLLNGGPHKNGTTDAALREISKTLKDEGIESDIFWIGNKPIASCIACKTCAKKKSCVFDDDKVNEFLSIAEDYDGFVFGTPVHWGGPTGEITSFLGRVFYADFLSGSGRFFMKPAAAISTARRAGTTSAWDQINKYFGLMQMPIVSSRYWNMVYGANAEEAEKDTEGMQCMRFLARNMAFMLKCIKAGKEAGISLPEQEKISFMNFIR